MTVFTWSPCRIYPYMNARSRTSHLNGPCNEEPEVICWWSRSPWQLMLSRSCDIAWSTNSSDNFLFFVLQDATRGARVGYCYRKMSLFVGPVLNIKSWTKQVPNPFFTLITIDRSLYVQSNVILIFTKLLSYVVVCFTLSYPVFPSRCHVCSLSSCSKQYYSMCVVPTTSTLHGDWRLKCSSEQ